MTERNSVLICVSSEFLSVMFVAVPCGSVASGKNLDFSDVFFAFSRVSSICSVFERFWTFQHAFGCFFTVLKPSIPWSEY